MYYRCGVDIVYSRAIIVHQHFLGFRTPKLLLLRQHLWVPHFATYFNLATATTHRPIHAHVPAMQLC